MAELSDPTVAGTLSAISVAIAVLGIIAAFYFYIKGKRTKAPCWAVVNKVLIQDYTTKLTDLQVLYKGEPVRNLSVAKVMFCNAGSETVNRADIAAANPLVIRSKSDAAILDATIIEQNHTPSQFGVGNTSGNSTVPLTFDYADRENGVIIQVVHTSVANDIAVQGEIKGAKLRNRKIGQRTATRQKLQKRQPRPVMLSIGPAAFLLVPIIFIILYFFGVQGAAGTDVAFLIVIWVAFGILAVAMFWLTYIYLPPKGLESFLDDWASPGQIAQNPTFPWG